MAEKLTAKQRRENRMIRWRAAIAAVPAGFVERGPSAFAQAPGISEIFARASRRDFFELLPTAKSASFYAARMCGVTYWQQKRDAAGKTVEKQAKSRIKQYASIARELGITVEQFCENNKLPLPIA